MGPGRTRLDAGGKMVKKKQAESVDGFAGRLLTPMILEPGILKKDRSYQRGVRGWQFKVMGDWDEIACMGLLVGRRRDGTFWVVEGQERWEKAKRDNVKGILCLVFESTGPEMEARYFSKISRSRANMTSLQQHKAGLAARDPVAMGVDRVVGGLGLWIPGENERKKKDGEVTCVRTLEMLYVKMGADGLKKVLETAASAWFTLPQCFQDRLLVGVGLFLEEHAEDLTMTEERVKRLLGKKSPREWLDEAAQGMTTASRASGRMVSRAFEEAGKKEFAAAPPGGRVNGKRQVG